MTSSYYQIMKLIKSKRDISKIPGKNIDDELHLQENNLSKLKFPQTRKSLTLPY